MVQWWSILPSSAGGVCSTPVVAKKKKKKNKNPVLENGILLHALGKVDLKVLE